MFKPRLACARKIEATGQNERVPPRRRPQAVAVFTPRLFVFWVLLLALSVNARAALPAWDFSTEPQAGEWGTPHDCHVGPAQPGRGLPLTLTAADPYLFGPARTYPTGQALWLNLRLRSECGGNGQVFFFQTGPSEEQSVRFVAPAGEWTTVRLPLPALGANYRLRIDPPGDRGTCVLGRLTFEPREFLPLPEWPQPLPPILAEDAPSVRSGDLELLHGPGFGGFLVRVAGAAFASGNAHAQLGYLTAGGPRWLPLTNRAQVTVARSVVQVTLAVVDADGAKWRIEQRFQPARRAGGIEVETRVTVDRERRVVFLPLLTLLPGVGAAFGTNKTQGLFAGVEYLENEASSSERDLIGAQARRQVPDSLKVTFPLMALVADGRWAALTWESGPHVCALHDTPDRVFNSGGSALALLFPGADPAARADGHVLPYEGRVLAAQAPLILRATILGGRGATVVPAVQEYVVRRGLPPLPQPGYSAGEYFTLAARGWLDSQIRAGDQFRHAVGPTFGSAPAADAVLYLDWLAAHVGDAALAGRLTDQAKASLARLAPAARNRAAVGHVQYPVAALVYGGVAENVAAAQAEGRAFVARFQPDGTMPFERAAGAVDLGSTHWSREANGLAGTHVLLALERAVLSSDRPLLADALKLLRGLNRFRDSVPRGAQTWEVPLHTPDILASAYLCRAYLLGYELTGEEDFLAQARYWAWTGIPFIYLTAPTTQPVGVYSTIAVLGATQFVAPNWIGLPVQWCGLVYADAIRRLARHDASAPWRQLADGIAFAGVQQTHRATEPDQQGLLPDSFDLRAQFRNPVPINPATLLPLALQAFGEPAVYDFRAFWRTGLRVHAPGPISAVVERRDGVQFRVQAWPATPWHVLVQGVTSPARVRLNGRDTPLLPPHSFDAVAGQLILQLTNATTLEVFVGDSVDQP
jgi:hypothetical protein